MKRGKKFELTLEELIYISELHWAGFSQKDLGELYNRTQSSISLAIKRFKQMKKDGLVPDYQFDATVTPPTLHINKVTKDPVITTVRNLKPAVPSPEPTKIDIAKEFLVSNDELLAYGKDLEWRWGIADKMGHTYERNVLKEKLDAHFETLEIVQKILAKLI